MKKQSYIYPNNIFEAIVVVVLFLFFSGVLIFINLVFGNLINIYIMGGLSMLIGVFVTKRIIEKWHSQRIELNFKFTKDTIFYKILFLLVFLIIGLITPLLKIISSYNGVLLNPLNDFYYLLGGLLIAPFVEEILFRRIILSGLLTKYNYKVAIFITSLLFALMHFTSLSHVFTAFMFGVFSGYLYFRTSNLLSVIFLHFFNNLIRTICNYFHYKYGASQVHSISDIYGKYSVYIISISLMLFVFLLFKRTGKYLVSREESKI